MRLNLDRRLFLKILGAAGLVATTDTVACGSSDEASEDDESNINLDGYEYIVVGSGAGGGPLAANLARAGHKVLLLEAGDDQGDNINQQVPAFHGSSSEDPAMRWDYYVKHYSDPARQSLDKKLTWDTPDGKLHVGPNPPAGSKAKGILYPRAGTLGGCTTHNAMITVYPHESDWNAIADMTNDETWRADKMRRYFEILERCEYVGNGAVGHGTKGWLSVSKANPTAAGLDVKLLSIFKGAALAIGSSLIDDIRQLFGLLGRDFNEPGPKRDAAEDIYAIPLAITNGRRNGPREYMVDTVKKGFPLTIRTGCLATKVLFAKDAENGKVKAIGVEFLDGKHLYAADPTSKASNESVKGKATASREVILAAGAYNTPQLLKLSGIGPRAELEKFSIPVKVDLPGVGTNLQDRYEVGVVSEVASDFSALEGCTFNQTPNDPCLANWRAGKGVYTTNGAIIGVVKRSSVASFNPDLFVFGAPGNFHGYFPGYSKVAIQDKRHFTWAVLKAHTENRAGTVTLRSADPRDVPEIDFKYFDFGTKANVGHEQDVQAVVDGIKFAREIGRRAGNLMGDDIPLLGGKFEEQVPGPALDTDDKLKEFVRNEAWGHHASCTCPIGPDSDKNAVLDSKFRVRGTTGLRVVDASVFPRIPGFFIVVPIYMVSEKATDVLLEDIGEKRKV